jgi:hypothetical protein
VTVANRTIAKPPRPATTPPPMGDRKGLPSLPATSPTPGHRGVHAAPPGGVNSGRPQRGTGKANGYGKRT